MKQGSKRSRTRSRPRRMEHMNVDRLNGEFVIEETPSGIGSPSELVGVALKMEPSFATDNTADATNRELGFVQTYQHSAAPFVQPIIIAPVKIEDDNTADVANQELGLVHTCRHSAAPFVQPIIIAPVKIEDDSHERDGAANANVPAVPTLNMNCDKSLSTTIHATLDLRHVSQQTVSPSGDPSERDGRERNERIANQKDNLPAVGVRGTLGTSERECVLRGTEPTCTTNSGSRLSQSVGKRKKGTHKRDGAAIANVPAAQTHNVKCEKGEASTTHATLDFKRQPVALFDDSSERDGLEANERISDQKDKLPAVDVCHVTLGTSERECVMRETEPTCTTNSDSSFPKSVGKRKKGSRKRDAAANANVPAVPTHNVKCEKGEASTTHATLDFKRQPLGPFDDSSERDGLEANERISDHKDKLPAVDVCHITLGTSERERILRGTEPTCTTNSDSSFPQSVGKRKKGTHKRDGAAIASAPAAATHNVNCDESETSMTHATFDLRQQTLLSPCDDSSDLDGLEAKKRISDQKDKLPAVVVRDTRLETSERECVVRSTEPTDSSFSQPVEKPKKGEQCKECSKYFARGYLKVHMRTHSAEMPFSCSVCSKSFPQQGRLKRHVRTHTGEKSFHCPVCSKSFSVSTNLKYHLHTHTGEENPFPCSMCEKSFCSAYQRVRHMRTHTRPHVCSLCSKSYPLSCDLKAHMRTHTGEKPYLCSVCSKQFSRAMFLKSHMRTHEALKPYACSVCSKTYTSNWLLKRHMCTHTDDKTYLCSNCGKAFNHLQGLKSHLRTHEGRRPYQCPVCSKSYSRSDNLKAHTRNHTETRPHFPCTVCSKSFLSNRYLKIHMLVHTEGKSAVQNKHRHCHALKKSFPCSVCTKSFASSRYLQFHMCSHAGGGMSSSYPVCAKSVASSPDLKSHMCSHAGGNTYPCSVCTKSFASSHDRNKHMHSHPREASHPCSVCPKLFALSHDLKAHMRTHAGGKPHPCSVCKESFSRAHCLKAHMRTHQGGKSYKCPRCFKLCSRSGNLKAHMRTHTGKRPFPCTSCSKSFEASRDLNSHMRRQHAAEKY